MLEMGLSEITILILLEYLAVDRKSVFIVISLGPMLRLLSRK